MRQETKEVVDTLIRANRGEAGDRFQEHFTVLVDRFALPTSGQALAGQQKRRHVLCQVGQRRQRLRKRAQELADVIACCHAVLVSHGLHDHDRGEHVRREIRKSGPKNVRVDCADACEKSSGEGAARENEILKSLCLVMAKRWRLTTAEAALLAWALGSG